MEKDQAIALIKGRIMDEYRKHPQLDWADIVARKLHEQWNEYFKDNQSLEEVGDDEKHKKYKLTHQLFIGKVAELIGADKTTELLKQAYDAINSASPSKG